MSFRPENSFIAEEKLATVSIQSDTPSLSRSSSPTRTVPFDEQKLLGESNEQESCQTPSRMTVACTIAFHSSCAIAGTLISKAALNKLNAPVLLLSLQFTVQVVLLTVIGIPMGWIKPLKSLATWKSIFPLTLARLTGVLAKTFCLGAVDAAFYQVARGLLLPFTILLSFLLLRPTPYFPPLSLVGVGTVMGGFGAGLSTDVISHLTDTKGVILGIGSSFTTAVESVVVKRYLKPKTKAIVLEDESEHKEEELGVWQMVWMSNVLFIVFFVPLLFITGDIATLGSLFVMNTSNDPADTASVNKEFLPLAILTGSIGFLLTIATFMQINVTSPTTHMIVTASRGVAQSALATLILREPVTVGRASSMGLILTGSALYAWAKDRYTFPTSDDKRGQYIELRPAP